MANLVVAFPDGQGASSIKALLMRSGYHVSAAVTSGTAALQAADRLGCGVMVCSYRFRDMTCGELRENLPETFGMLASAPADWNGDEDAPDISILNMPIKARELIQGVDNLLDIQEKNERTLRRHRHLRTEAENRAISRAKELLMDRNAMTETEAHRYLQKTSMNNGTGMAETAQMIIELMEN